MEHAHLAIELLQGAHDLSRRSPKPAPRRIHHIGGLLATEHLALGDAATAQRLLQAVVGVPPVPQHARSRMWGVHCPSRR